MLDGDDLIEIRDDAVKSGLSVGLRQIILSGAGYAFGSAIGESAWVEAGAALAILGATVGYGQLKSYRDKKKAVALADAAPNGVVVK